MVHWKTVGVSLLVFWKATLVWFLAGILSLKPITPPPISESNIQHEIRVMQNLDTVPDEVLYQIAEEEVDLIQRSATYDSMQKKKIEVDSINDLIL